MGVDTRKQLKGDRRSGLRISKDNLTAAISVDRNQDAAGKGALHHNVVGDDTEAGYFQVEILEKPNDETGTTYKVPFWEDGNSTDPRLGVNTEALFNTNGVYLDSQHVDAFTSFRWPGGGSSNYYRESTEAFGSPDSPWTQPAPPELNGNDPVAAVNLFNNALAANWTAAFNYAGFIAAFPNSHLVGVANVLNEDDWSGYPTTIKDFEMGNEVYTSTKDYETIGDSAVGYLANADLARTAITADNYSLPISDNLFRGTTGNAREVEFDTLFLASNYDAWSIHIYSLFTPALVGAVEDQRTNQNIYEECIAYFDLHWPDVVAGVSKPLWITEWNIAWDSLNGRDVYMDSFMGSVWQAEYCKHVLNAFLDEPTVAMAHFHSGVIMTNGIAQVFRDLKNP